eukprot:1145700-Pelagomonas_calceolata.AAC.2
MIWGNGRREQCPQAAAALAAARLMVLGVRAGRQAALSDMLWENETRAVPTSSNGMSPVAQANSWQTAAVCCCKACVVRGECRQADRSVRRVQGFE